MRRALAAIPKHHKKCLSKAYCQDETQARFPVPEDKIKWEVDYPEYAPDDFQMPHVLKNPVWADPNLRVLVDVQLKFNEIDGKIDRRSHMGPYKLDDQGTPVNPVGRTGLTGRGTLGKWGPNHAADPIVTRWKRDATNKKILHQRDKKPVLQFIAIVRRDHGDWAIPGGMVDAGENVSVTLKREFSEETMNALDCSAAQKAAIQEQLEDLFKGGTEIYRGYVDDPRNTDNSWMETVAVNFHDEEGSSVGAFRLNAGDDATGVKWTDIDRNLELFASHSEFIEKVAKLHNAHW